MSEKLLFEDVANDYCFDTQPKSAEFSVAYSSSIAKDDITVMVALKKGSREQNRRHKKCVFILDISGSMRDCLYDEQASIAKLGKLEIAKQAIQQIINEILDQKNDHVGVIAFDNIVETVQPLMKVEDINKKEFSTKLSSLQPRNGTDMGKGLLAGLSMLINQTENDDCDRRLLVLTDMCGSIDDKEFSALKEKLSSGILTAYIGIGTRFDSRLVEKLKSFHGLNYFATETHQSFKRLFVDNFDELISSTVNNITISLPTKEFWVSETIGPPTINIINCKEVYVGNYCTNGEKGGILLLKLKKSNQALNDRIYIMPIITRYFDGEKERQLQTSVDLDLREPIMRFYSSIGIRKAMLLHQFVEVSNVVRDYMRAKRSNGVNKDIHKKVLTFKELFDRERTIIVDTSLDKLQQDVEILANIPVRL
jgi:uncharacterized protein YegL